MRSITYRKKNVLLLFLSALCCILCSFALLNVKRASAETSAAPRANFGLTEGAYVRASTDYETAGIRYQFETSEEVYNRYKLQGAQFGVIIVPQDIVTEGREINAKNVFGIGGTAIYNWAEYNQATGAWVHTPETGKTRIANFSTKTLYKLESGAWGFNGSLVNLNEKNLLREFQGYAYVKIGDSVEFFTNDENVRSMVYVAQAAVEKGSEYADLLQEQYLDKVADKNATYTVNHHKIAVDGTDTVETESFTAALGLTVGDLQKDYAGYTFDKAYAGTKTSGIVYANDRLVLEYYYTEVEMEEVNALDQIITAGTMTDVTGTVAAPAGVSKVYSSAISGWTLKALNSVELSAYSQVKFYIQKIGDSDAALFPADVGDWNKRNYDLTAGQWAEITLTKNAEGTFDVTATGATEVNAYASLTDLSGIAVSAQKGTFYVSNLIGTQVKKIYDATVDQIFAPSNGTTTIEAATAEADLALGISKITTASITGWGIPTLSDVDLSKYSEAKFYIKKSTTGDIYYGGSDWEKDWAWQLVADQWAEVTLTRNADGKYDVSVTGANKQVKDIPAIGNLNELIISCNTGVLYVSNLMGIALPTTSADSAYDVVKTEDGTSAGKTWNGAKEGYHDYDITGGLTYRVTVKDFDYTAYDSATIGCLFNYNGIVLSDLNGNQIYSTTANTAFTLTVLKDGSVYCDGELAFGAKMENGVIAFDVTRLNSHTYAAAYFSADVSYDTFEPAKEYINVQDQIFTPSNGTTTVAPFGGNKITTVSITGWQNKEFMNVAGLENFTELKFYIKKDTTGDLYQGGNDWETNWAYQLIKGQWAAVTLTKNAKGTFDVTVTGANKQAKDIEAISDLSGITVSCEGDATTPGIFYVSNLMGIADPNHTHDYSNIVVLQNSTCTASGEQKKICKYCDEYIIEDITELKSHNYMTSTTVAVCGVDGVKTSTCLYCGDVQTVKVADALEHVYGDVILVRDATCSKAGETKQECSLCGDVKVSSIEKTAHTSVEAVKEATAYKEGIKQTVCSVCGEVESETLLPATGLGVTYTINEGNAQTIALSQANVTPTIIDENGDETGYENPFWQGALVATTLKEKGALSNSVAQATVNGTATTWRYFRNVINVDVTKYEEVSFDIAISVSRTSAFDVKIGGAVIRITENQTWKNVKILQNGSVYFDNVLVEGAKVTGSNIVVDIDTLTTQTEQNYSSFYISSELTAIATTRDVTLVSGNNLMGTKLTAVGGTAGNTFGFEKATDDWCLSDTLKYYSDPENNVYAQVTVGIDYRKFSEVTVYVAINTGAASFKLYVGDEKYVTFGVAKVFYPLTVKTDGSVYFNGALLEGATMKDGVIAFTVDSASTNYSAFYIQDTAQIELGDFAGYDTQDLVVEKEKFSQCVIDENGNVVEDTNKDNFWDTPNNTTGLYRMYLSNTTNSVANGATYYRYFRAIIDVDFTQYEYVSFDFAINQVQGGGVGFNVTLGGVKYNLAAAGTYTVEIAKNGGVSINGMPLAGAKMTGNQIVIDLDTCATATNYRCIDIYYTFTTGEYAPTEITLTKDNATQYGIVYESGNSEASFAATELSKYFGEATGVTLSTSAYTDINAVGSKRIVLAIDSTIGKSCDYKVVVDGTNIYVYGASGYGVINGVYALLDRLFNLEIYYKGVYTLDATTENVILPLALEIIGERTFDYMWAGTGELTPSESNGYSQEYGYNMGMVTNYYTQNVSTKGWHNATTMIDYETYGAEHDDWFYKESGEVKQLYLAVEDFSTAEGSLVWTVAEKIWAEMQAENMKQRTITCMFSQMDNGVWANGSSYPKSQALLDKYGTHAAENIMFTNAVAALIDAKLSDNNPYGQPITMQMLSYHRSLVAPDLTRSGITAEDIAAVQLYRGTNVKVVPYVAPVEGNYYMAFEDSRNVVRNPLTGEFDGGSPTVAEAIASWEEFTDEIHLWTYSLDATNYFMPVDVLTNMQANYKFAAEHHVTVLMDQNQYNEYGAMTDWARLKNYVRAELGRDINTDVDAAIDNFMNAYFGAGGAKMKELLIKQQTWYGKLVEESKVGNSSDPRYYAGNLYGYQSLNKKWCFTENPEKPLINLGQGNSTFIKSWMTLIEEAKAAIDADGSLTTEQKAELCKRVDIESLTARFILIEIYGDKSYDNSTSAFYAYAKSLGMTQSGENGAL